MTVTHDVAPATGSPTTRPLSAVLVDDHQLLAQSLALALELEGVECTVAELSCRATLLDAVRRRSPDLVLLDLDLGGSIGDGSTLISPFVAAGCVVLVVTASGDIEQLGRALELGAVGVVRKDIAFTRLLDAALAAARGDVVTAPAERARLIQEARACHLHRSQGLAPFERLSPREAAVLLALCGGLSVATIATRAYVAEATVRSQVRAILTKLGVCSQLEAVAMAHHTGWL